MRKCVAYFFLVICLMAISPAVEAQYQMLFNDQSFNWDKIQVDIEPESKYAFIKQLLEKPAFARIANISYELLLNNFHFLDLNGDGVLDAIYNGGYGGENDIILFAINHNGDWIISMPVYGQITDVQELEGEFRVKIFDYGCCADVVDVFAEFVFQCEQTTCNRKSIYAFGKIKDTQLPEDFIKETKFEVQNEGYRLRAQPEIKMKYDDLPEELIIDGNTLAIYSKGSTGTAIAKHIDQSGRLWWFVVMDHYKKPLRSIFAPRSYNIISYKSTGWISSRFLTVKN